MRVRRLFSGIVLVGVTALALGSALPLASAASSSDYVTRGAYVEHLLQAVGIQPLTRTSQNFSDVSPSSPYFGYVEAAYHAGITTGMTAPSGSAMGVFGVSQYLNRAEAAAFDLRAYDGGVASYVQSAPSSLYGVNSTAFLMTAGVPKALQNDVFGAVDIGLMRGLADGTFGAKENLTSAQTADLISQLKAVEATGSPYNWRWIVTANSGLAETSSANAMNFFADAVAGKPFSDVANYIDPADASALQTAYGQIEKGAAGYFNGGLQGTANATIKIVGGGFAAGSATSGGGWHGAALAIVVAASSATGKPNSVNGNSPYIKLLAPIDTAASGLVVQAYPPVSSSSISSVSPGESVAGVAMYYLGGTDVIFSNSENAAAVVGGLGLAQTAGQ